MKNFEYLTPENIKEIHVEVSNLCNASCPMCARNKNGFGLRDNPGWGQWQKDDIPNVFSKELKNLKKVYFCGTHGDPITFKYLIDAIQHLKSNNIDIEIFTNGSLQNESWWDTLTSHLTSNDKIAFGIDGVETNHLYRQGTEIDLIIRNLKICCNSNVKTQWDFLAFKHNEHELDSCKKLADNLGVDKFRIRKTPRFKSDSFEVKNKFGEFSHYLEPPKNKDLRHPDLDKIKTIFKETPTNYNINCIYREASKIYVNSRLEVFPCCYISDNNESMVLNKNDTEIFFPINEFSLRKNSWRKILEHPFYREKFVKSFSNNKTMKRCILTCGVVDREKNQNIAYEKSKHNE
jgi:MoaA/NifB/PqqE/SkfB family radical SAM enzyme